MRRSKILAFFSLTILCFVGFSGSLQAQSLNTFGGNNASDYQPPTRNPQSDVGTGVQQNNGNLQPVSGQQTAGTQEFPEVETLKVLSQSTTQTSAPEQKPTNTRPIKLYIGLAVLTIMAIACILYLVSRQSQPELVVAEPAETVATITQVKQKIDKKKKTKQNKARKKRKK